MPPPSAVFTIEEREPVRVGPRQPVRAQHDVRLLGLLAPDQASRPRASARRRASTGRSTPTAPRTERLARRPCGRQASRAARRAGRCRRPPPPGARARSGGGRSRGPTRASRRGSGPCVPRIGRPSGCPGHSASVNTSCTTSSGESSCMSISDRITSASASRSAAAIVRVLEHVGEVVDRHLEVTVEHARVVARVLLGGERVHVAADRVERLRDVEGRARGRCP